MKSYFNNFYKTLFVVLLIVSFSPISTFSQKWVSTNPENKKVILEEFTGINCTWCPDGHRVANQLAQANAGKVFLINVHAGGYAAPQTNQPDYRTPIGTEIDKAAGVTGYPAGSLNRFKTPWSEGRGTWANTAQQIMVQSSPVNVFVKSTVDFETRKLTTEVEVYYTADVSVDNYLTIFLTQNNIMGPQIDGANSNPGNWVNGLYRHNHMLRMAITPNGAWGEKIEQTTSGSYINKTFTTDLPEAINSIPIEMHNLEVVAFVSEYKNNIYSGHGSKVEFNKDKFTDLGLTNLTSFPNTYKIKSLNPKIEVTNYSGKNVTSFDVKAIINGKTNTKTFSGNLAQNEKTVIDFGDIAFDAIGFNTFEISGFTNVNNDPKFVDMDISNNGVKIEFIAFKEKAFTSFLAGFDGTIPEHTVLDYSSNQGFQAINGNASTRYGANNTTGTILFYLHSSWGIAGKPGWVMFGEADLSSASSSKVSYYYAYSDGQQGGTQPQIKTQVSEDFGLTWKDVNTIKCEETGQPANLNNLYIPVSSEYKLIDVDLNAYNGKTVLVRVGVIPGTSGNAMFLDEVSLSSSSTSVAYGSTIDGNFNMTISPNPVNTEAQFNYSIANDNSNVRIYVMDITGKIAAELVNSNMNSGNYNLNFSAAKYVSGTYYIMAEINGSQAQIPVIIAK